MFGRVRVLPASVTAVSTARDCQGGALARADALKAGFDEHAFALTSEEVRMARMLAGTTPSATQFWDRTRAFLLTLDSVEDLRSWGGGCACHEADRRAGKVVTCGLAGRRLREAWAKVQRTVDGLAALETRAPAMHPWLERAGLVADVQQSASMARARLFFKLGYLNKLPYMLCRARDRAVAQLCMQEFDSFLDEHGQESAVDGVTDRILGKCGVYRADFVAWATTGHMSDRLSRAFQQYEWLLLDESSVGGSASASVPAFVLLY